MVYGTQQYTALRPDCGFAEALLINYLYFQIFNLMDLIVFDWLIYMVLKPAFMRPDYFPVIEGLNKHLVDFRNGLVLALVPSLMSVGIWLLMG